MNLRNKRLYFASIILAVSANLGIIIWTERARAQTADERAVSPALRISPLPERRVLEEADTFAVDECLSAPFRCIDGTGNNLRNPSWGIAGAQLLRHVDPDYGDEENIGEQPRTGPNPREISNAVNAQFESIPNANRVSDMVWAWGQFLDHDIDLTIEEDPPEIADIPVENDPDFGDADILFNRSAWEREDPARELSQQNPRQQINFITAFIDASNVYGSDHERAEALRDPDEPWRLRTSEGDQGDLLPFNDFATPPFPNAGGEDPGLFLAGDVRANEQVLLTALHTLFVREHNRLADIIADANPLLTDEEIYQEARKIVGAEMQSITYNEFLPVLLGKVALGKYKGYNPNVDPGIANVFSTAAFRLGHSMLNSTLKRVDADFNEDGTCGHLALRDAFFAPDEISTCGIASILRGTVTQLAQTVDTPIIDDVRNFLFGPPGAGGFDLASLNIQRGRDHGVPAYNDVRVAYGLPLAVSFDDVTSDLEISDRLASIYDGPNDCDPWVCMLAEDHVRGALVGESMRTILINQFQRLRDGDRFWYELTLTRQELRELPTLGEILNMSAGVAGIGDPFHVTR